MQYWFIGLLFDSRLELVILHVLMYQSYKKLSLPSYVNKINHFLFILLPFRAITSAVVQSYPFYVNTNMDIIMLIIILIVAVIINIIVVVVISTIIIYCHHSCRFLRPM
jgi:hypothetical protein